MQFAKLALLAAAVSAAPAALEERGDPWQVAHFSAEHVPHSSSQVTEFHIKGDGFDTKCFKERETKAFDGFGIIKKGHCKDPDVTFAQFKVENEEHTWIFEVAYNGVRKYVSTAVTTFREGGFEWKKLDLPQSFKLRRKED